MQYEVAIRAVQKALRGAEKVKDPAAKLELMLLKSELFQEALRRLEEAEQEKGAEG